MSETEVVQTTLPKALIERIDAYAFQLNREYPGARFSRSGILKLLVEKALGTESAWKDHI
jgi:hypothetical protein